MSINFKDLLGRKRAGLKADAAGEDAFDRADRQSLGFFVNKVLGFYEGLASLKSELVAAGRKRQRRSGSGGFFKSELFGEQRRRRTRSSLSARHRRKESSDGGQEEEASDDKTLARLRKVESLQLKIGRMTGSREFKLFFAWINNESGKGKAYSAAPSDCSFYSCLV